MFLHIPKTAGTTLHKILTHQYERSRTHIHHDADGPPPEELIERMNSEPPGVSLVLGHIGARFHSRVPDVRYITCLRDPVSRVRSHYEHAKADPDHYLHKAACELSLADYVRSGLSGELSDGMVRMLAGLEDFHGTKVDQAVFNRALQVLDQRMAGCVLTCRFDETLLALASDLKWKTPWYLPRKVGSYGKSRIDPGDREAIREMNLFDLQLFDHAVARWKERQTARREDFAAAVAAFRRRNAGVGRVAFLAREACRRAGIVAPF